ncbi:MAG TPA: hypothetical protein VKB86_07720 [Pyrinomonadaceae bacterium]|nr:hypothetical protein [Pyrinomonadaceae bacterium]
MKWLRNLIASDGWPEAFRETFQRLDAEVISGQFFPQKPYHRDSIFWKNVQKYENRMADCKAINLRRIKKLAKYLFLAVNSRSGLEFARLLGGAPELQ